MKKRKVWGGPPGKRCLHRSAMRGCPGQRQYCLLCRGHDGRHCYTVRF